MVDLAAPTKQSISRGFSDEELKKSEDAKAFNWNARTVPTEYDPVQLNDIQLDYSFIDWWNTRSPLFCCCFPLIGCLSSSKSVDGTDPSVWTQVLENPNPKIPPSMQGVYWLKDNHAHEQLVSIFSHADLTGTFNVDGTDGYGEWSRSLEYNWSRDKTCFGYILAFVAKRTENSVNGVMNLKDGILTVHSGRGRDTQIVYKINDDEWWKVHYLAGIGQEGDQEYDFMYKWLKVIDKDGKTTKHWDEYVEWSNKPTPHLKCCAPYLPCWPGLSCISPQKIAEIMVLPNKKQIVRLKNGEDDQVGNA